MLKKLNLSLVASLLVNLNVFAEIHEIKQISQVLNYINTNQKQMVIFDIDNTLLCPAQDLGSDQWFSYHLKKHMLNGLDLDTAVNLILPTYIHLQNHLELVPTEANLVNNIKLIELACNHTICLTARSLGLVTRTCEQLAKNQLFFQVPEINHGKLNLPNHSLYQDGVLFCGNNCKGTVLIKFLQACHFVPNQIILVDDKLYNLQAVEKQLSEINIHFVGLRYAGCDERIANFDSTKTQIELDNFLAQNPLN